MNIQSITQKYHIGNFNKISRFKKLDKINFTSKKDLFHKTKYIRTKEDEDKLENYKYIDDNLREKVLKLNNSYFKYCIDIIDMANESPSAFVIDTAEYYIQDLINISHNKKKKGYIAKFQRNGVEAIDMVNFLKEKNIKRSNIEKAFSLMHLGVDKKNALYLATSPIKEESLSKYYHELVEINPKAVKNIGKILSSQTSYDDIKKALSIGATHNYEISKILSMDEKKQSLCEKLIKKYNIPAFSAIEITNLSEQRRNRCLALIKKGVGIGDAILYVNDLANTTKLRDKDGNKLSIKRAKTLHEKGVLKLDYRDCSYLFPEKEERFSLNDGIKGDINRCYSAHLKGIPLKEAFISKFDRHTMALKTIKNGDLYTLDDKKTYMKVSKEEICEIKLSPEKYMEIFPPVGRFLTMQNDIGNCALLSVYHTLMSKPEGRAYLYECFKENEDGSVTISLPSGEKQNFNDFKNIKTRTTGCPAMKMLEAVMSEKLAKATIENYSDMMATQREQRKEIIDINKFCKEVRKTGFKKTKQEMIDLINSTSLDDDAKEYVLNDLFIKTIEGKEIFNRAHFDEINSDTKKRKKNLQTLPKDMAEKIKKLTGENVDRADIWENGTFSSQLLRYLNIESGVYNIESDAIELLISPDYWKYFVYTLDSKKDKKQNLEDKKSQIVESHAYIVQPFISDKGEISFKITNPWNTSYGIIADLETIENNFIHFVVGQVS